MKIASALSKTSHVHILFRETVWYQPGFIFLTSTHSPSGLFFVMYRFCLLFFPSQFSQQASCVRKNLFFFWYYVSFSYVFGYYFRVWWKTLKFLAFTRPDCDLSLPYSSQFLVTSCSKWPQAHPPPPTLLTIGLPLSLQRDMSYPLIFSQIQKKI